MRRFLSGIILIAVLLALGWVVYAYVWAPARAQQEPIQYEVATVQRGDIANTVSAIGSITPDDEVSLSFRGTGRVVDVNVAVGQQVAAGELLAALDTSDLILALAQDNVNLQIAETELDILKTPADEDEITAAEIAVDVARANVDAAEAAIRSAQANYQRLLDGPSADEIQFSEAELRQAEATLRLAQSAYDQVKNLPNIGALPQSLALEQATLAYEKARAKAAQALRPASASDLAAASNQIAQAEYLAEVAKSDLFNAQRLLNKLHQGPSEDEVSVAESHVLQAELSKLQRENSLAAARLEAPIGGLISQVNIEQGENPNLNQPDIVLIGEGGLSLKVQVDEIDVGQVEVGQPVRMVIDALPEEELAGTITEIAPTANSQSGVVAYEVTVLPERVVPSLRPGMSATAIITTAEQSGVPLLPNRFIQIDRSTGQAAVYVLNNEGMPVLQAVEIGLRNDTDSQIAGGLSVGDQVVLVTDSSEARFRDALFRRGE